ncbi:MAG: serine/threonine protein kinase [Cyanobacteria bacterium SZAS LIN-3]|nr:serine/threonine protein kinase [Cyanobacteria bacterium SZAS LIN-3]MBS2005732.1 serine/threonine protein kinase [Cyanobacteria bacterium SZAS TMP-1]
MDDYLKEESRIEIKDSPESGNVHVPAPTGLPPQYEIIEEIGHGGMGTVYKARHSQLGTYVAVKVINTDLLEGKNETKENAQKRFVNESKAVSQLQQENVIALKDYGVTAEGSPFMIMEYAEGKTLDTMVKGGPMEYKSVLSIMRGVCDGLEHAHAIGLVHRDIKPSNIIVTRSAAGREIPKLLDFGIARITGEDGKTQGLTSTGEVFGSPYCIAPEQSLSSKVDRRADIYSLGCVLFECITGKPPYAGDTAMHTIMMHLNSPIPSASAVLGKTLPPDLEFIINRCLQKDPNKRYQNAAALKADIDLLLAGKHLKRTALGGAASSKHIKAFVIMGAAAVAISTAGLMALFLLQSNPPAPNQTTPASGNLERDAYGVDVGEAYSAFIRGDYNHCIILQKGAIGVYDDRLEAISKEIAKGASGSTLRDLNNEATKLQCWKADNLKHIGDCYRLLSRNNEALSYYNKGLEIYRRWAFTGYKSNDLGECYRYAIEILQKLSRTDDAKLLQQEYERYLHAR